MNVYEELMARMQRLNPKCDPESEMDRLLVFHTCKDLMSMPDNLLGSMLLPKG